MLLLNELKIVIFTPNKCGSTTLNETLCGKGIGQMVLGPQGPYVKHGFTYNDCIGKHSMFVPFWCQDWRKILITRNPYDRFVSMWRHFCRYHKQEIEFPEFVDRMIPKFRTEAPANWFYTRRMRDFIEESPPETELFDVSEFDKLAKVVGVDSFPKLHATEHMDYKEYYTPSLYRKAYDYV